MQTGAHSFHLPDQLLASSPPEKRGIARDRVRLLVLERISGRIHHTVFTEIGKFLNPGDLLVFNNSRTLPAVLNGTDPKIRSLSKCVWRSICRTIPGMR
jgi:S-adenosylmethionine:tRNA ribosyltransferase-isomerase